MYGDFTCLNTIRGVYNTGDISGDTHVGGLVGGSIQYLSNSGAVDTGKSKKYIYNSYNTGKVIGTGSVVGGLIGLSRAFDIYNSVNATDIVKMNSNTNSGALIGTATGRQVTYDNMYKCYYNSALAPCIVGKYKETDSKKYTGEVDKSVMVTTLSTDLGQADWLGEKVSFWKIIETENNGFPILFWE